MKSALLLVLAAIVLSGVVSTASAQQPAHCKLRAVPFAEVRVRDEFWAPRLRTNRRKSLPHNLKWCRQTGRFDNFAKAAGLAKGKFEGIYFNDSDVYKVLEGASYSLADNPDAALEKTVDEIIAKIAAAQQENGYLNTYYTLVEPDKKWTDCRVRHELYCAGHLFEAAVAHYRATGKRTLLEVAVKFADRIDEIFGPHGRCDVPGHEEIELALVKLHQVTGQQRYLKLARFFLDVRGDESKRKLYGAYCQDHQPVRRQSEITGHAVRAMYLYCGVADVAAYSGDRGLIDAMGRLWQDVIGRKMYITGGIGARHQGESFGEAYELPNRLAYAETCAAIGLALWSHRLNLLHGDAEYADVLERVIYNGFLSAVALGGEKFFYVNPLASNGSHHRQPFFSCACCPTNVVRFMPSLPGYVYAYDDEGVFVNLYIAGTGKVPFGEETIRLTQQTRYPWDGVVKLLVDPPWPVTMSINLRIPGWCEGATLAVGGKPVEKLDLRNGYARLSRRWTPGDAIELKLPMKIERVEAHPRVEANAGRVAVRRGPLVYCFEGVDNENRVRSIMLPHDPKFVVEHRPKLLGGVTVIKGVARGGRPIVAVPYYAWDHREAGGMIVWVRQDGKLPRPPAAEQDWQNRLYRPLDPATLGPSLPLPIAESSTPSASYCHGADTPDALNDQLEPRDSCDQSIPRFTWWDHRGTKEWVQYDFDSPRKVSAVEIYWFDDGRLKRHCRAPKSWRLLYAGDGTWKPVGGRADYGTQIDKYNRVSFEAVETTALRIEVELEAEFSGGILEWKVQ